MKKKVDMPQEESETTINYMKHQIGEWAEVYTTDKIIMRRYEKFCKEHPDYCQLVKEDKYAMTFSVHPKCASLYPRAPRKMTMSEEHKEKLREALVSARKKNA